MMLNLELLVYQHHYHLIFTGLGTGTHLLKVLDPNKQTLIMIDNIIQTPLTNKRLEVTVSEAVGINTETITVSVVLDH